MAEKTGWSKDSIINDFSFAELNMMINDAPRLVRKKKEKEEFSTDDELADWLGAE